ncbi:MAG: serine protease [Nanoarchaeota archaeon]
MANKNKLIPVLALATALSGCASTQSRSNANHDTILPNETIENILDASVKLEMAFAVTIDEETATVYSGTCSGTVLYDQQTEQNYVLTAEHCCPPEGSFEGKEVLGRNIIIDEFSAEVVKKNSDYDLALLKLYTKNLPYFNGKIAEQVEIGEIVAGASFPQNLFETLFKGHIAARDRETNGVLINEVRTVFEGHVDKGSSGAGVYVFQGNKMFLAGVLQGSYGSDGLKGMAPVEHLRKFFKGTDLEDEYL